VRAHRTYKHMLSLLTYERNLNRELAYYHEDIHTSELEAIRRIFRKQVGKLLNVQPHLLSVAYTFEETESCIHYTLMIDNLFIFVHYYSASSDLSLSYNSSTNKSHLFTCDDIEQVVDTIKNIVSKNRE